MEWLLSKWFVQNIGKGMIDTIRKRIIQLSYVEDLEIYFQFPKAISLSLISVQMLFG